MYACLEHYDEGTHYRRCTEIVQALTGRVAGSGPFFST